MRSGERRAAGLEQLRAFVLTQHMQTCFPAASVAELQMKIVLIR